jgi:hypothetical protein
MEKVAIYEDELIRAELSTDSISPLLVVHPYCFCISSMYDPSKRERLRSHPSYQGYLNNLENAIKEYKRELVLVEEGYNLARLAKLIRHFGRKDRFEIFTQEEDMLRGIIDLNKKFAMKMNQYKGSVINIAGGNLDQYTYHYRDGDTKIAIEFNGCLGAVAESLIDKGFRINIPPGLTFNHTFSMGFKGFDEEALGK